MASFIFMAVGVLAMAGFLVFRDKNGSMLAVCIKGVASLFFIATAVAALAYNPARDAVLLPALLTIGGLVLGMVGDITLDLKIYLKSLSYPRAQKDADAMTYYGMAAFGVGHILYILATALRVGFSLTLLWSALVALGATALIFTLSIFVMKMRFGKFLVPSICYAFLLTCFVTYSAWQLALTGVGEGSVLLLLGAILFIVSDLILSVTYFSKPADYQKQGVLNPESRLFIVTNHATYYAAQFLIALAVMYIA